MCTSDETHQLTPMVVMTQMIIGWAYLQDPPGPVYTKELLSLRESTELRGVY